MKNDPPKGKRRCKGRHASDPKRVTPSQHMREFPKLFTRLCPSICNDAVQHLRDRQSLLLSVFGYVLLHVYAPSVSSCMFMYVTFAVNAMSIFGNNRKIIVNNWTISQELWNRIIGKF